MPADLTWFREARFGMFVHWGLYSLAARHEWVRSREEMTAEQYQRYFDHFRPDAVDFRSWARTAANSGMRYAVLTTKHHDGFCLWDTRTTEFSSPHTPWARDAVAEFVSACRAEGLRVGLYFSLIDWHHPDFLIDELHPDRNRDFAELNAVRDMSAYRAYMRAQLTELLTGYGQIDYLFFDYTYPDSDDKQYRGKGPADWDAAGLLDLCRRLQPTMIVNDRLGIPGDFVTPEQYQPATALSKDGAPVPWEACQTMNGSWGYDRDNTDWKSPELVVQMLVDTVSKGGNMILNIGPDGQGRIDPATQRILDAVGDWHSRHSASVLGAGPAQVDAPSGMRLTQHGDRLYLHIFAWPFGRVDLPHLGERVRYAQFLHDASEVRISQGNPEVQADLMTPQGAPQDMLHLHLPTVRPPVAVPVIELFLDA